MFEIIAETMIIIKIGFAIIKAAFECQQSNNNNNDNNDSSSLLASALDVNRYWYNESQ